MFSYSKSEISLYDDSIDLIEEKWRIEEILPSDLVNLLTENDEITELIYPVLNYPAKVTSLTFDKETELSGILTGIRGQYLMFDNQFVMNIRRHTGYEIEWHA